MVVSQCFSCKHFDRPWVCKAFPDRIPIEVIENEVDHRKPVEGDHGIRFEPIDPGKPAQNRQ